MRTPLLIGCTLALCACNRSDTESSSLTHVTRIVVSPEEFLGDVSCGLPGGMQAYQATLYDVTEGLDRAFQLPSSLVVSCSSNVNFERVVEGNRYIATIVGFDVTGYQSQNPGSPIVVDQDGQPVTPRWSTTCWGTDESRDEYGQGGAAPTPDGPASGGLGGSFGILGTTAYYRTEMVVRGCSPLSTDTEPATTAVRFDLDRSLLGIECGEQPGNVGRYVVTQTSSSASVGGAGGAGPTDETQEISCGETLIWSALPENELLSFDALALDAVSGEPAWISECVARTRPGVTVSANCETFVEL